MTVTTGGQPTGASAGGVSDYAPLAPDSTRALSLRADWLRTKVDMLGGEVQELHGEARERDLTDRTFEKTKKSVSGLLEELAGGRSEEHTSELQSRRDLVCRLLLEKKKKKK